MAKREDATQRAPLSRPRGEQAATAQKKLAIEAAAGELFAASGLNGVSMRDIAAAAKVQLGTLSYLYRDKQELYDRVVETAVSHFGEALIAAASTEGSALARVESFIAAVVRLHADQTAYGQIIAREMIQGEGSRMAVLGRHVFRGIRQAMNPSVIALSGKALSDEAADRLTGRLIRMVHAATRTEGLYVSAFGQAVQDVDAQIAELKDLFLYGLIPRP